MVKVRIMGACCHFSTIFQLKHGRHFIGCGNQSTGEKKTQLMCHKPLNNFDNEEAGKIHFHDNLLSFMKNTKFSTQSIKNVIII